MSLWGNKDLVANGGSITINTATRTVTGSGTTFSTAGIKTGDVLVVGAGATYGQAVVVGVTSDLVLSIGSTQFLIPVAGAIPAGTTYFVSQKPKYTLEDHQYNAPDVKSNRFSAVFGVDANEVGVAAGTTVSGKAAAYAVAHSGWVGVTTYTDQHGNLRVKSEVLVAGGISTAAANDAADDTRFPDS